MEKQGVIGAMRVKCSEMAASRDAGWASLEARLLGIGGEKVVAMPEPHLDLLLDRGHAFKGRRPKMVKGWDNECHGNVAVRYLDSRGGFKIATGYGLSGGVWVQHSWLWDGERVLETTLRRRAYFGVLLKPVEAAKFVMCEIVGLAPGTHEMLKEVRRTREETC